MADSILFRGASNDNKEAKKVLIKSNIKFVEVFSDSRDHAPILFTNESIHSYKGLSGIKEYVKSVERQKLHIK